MALEIVTSDEVDDRLLRPNSGCCTTNALLGSDYTNIVVLKGSEDFEKKTSWPENMIVGEYCNSCSNVRHCVSDLTTFTRFRNRSDRNSCVRSISD